MFRALVFLLPAFVLLGEASSSWPTNFWEVDKVKSENKGGDSLQPFDYLGSGSDKNVMGGIANSNTDIEKKERTKGGALIISPLCDGDVDGAIILQNDDPNSNTIDTMSTLAGEVTVTEARSKQFPCPAEEHITPCVCQLDQQMELVMDCSSVTSSEELAHAFQSDYPVTEFANFILSHNPNVTYMDDLFNGVSFQHIFISDVVNLEVITDYSFMDSVPTLDTLFIELSKLHRYTFPFITIGEYRQLKELQLSYAHELTTIPNIITDSLTKISFDSSAIVAIENDTFSRAPMLEEINLNRNKISLLPSGTFLLRAALTSINLQNNNMTAMDPGAFMADTEGSSNQTLTIQLSSNALTSLEANTFLLTDRPTTIELYNNSLFTVEAGAFVMPSTAETFILHIDLRYNLITALLEGVWRAVFPSVDTLMVEGNPLSCDCLLAWLVLDVTFLSKLDEGAACEDGTLLTDLDEGHFESCYFAVVES